MSKQRPFHRNQEVVLTIDDLAFGGKGIAKVPTEGGQYVVFVPNVIPGQRVRCRIAKAKKQYAEAKLMRVEAPSDLEEAKSYHPIPGAPYMSLPIEKQRQFKERNTLELFRRIGKISDPESRYDRFIVSPRDYHYRNKMEYSFSAVAYDKEQDAFIDAFALGFKKRGQWLAVEPLEGDSGLFDQQWEDFIPQIARFFKDADLAAWHSRKHTGFARMITVKKSFAQDALLINLMTTSKGLERFDRTAFLQLIQSELGERLAGLVHTVNDDIGDRPLTTDGEQKILYGKDKIEEEIDNLRFEISLESFFQTNPASAERLYDQALDYVFAEAPPAQSVVLDLFSGTGTITQLLAQRAPQCEVIGVELVPEAVADAEANAERNQLSGLSFYAADVGKFLLEHPQYKGRIHTLTLDPPRAGIAPKTLRKVMDLDAKRMVYISCNPATQARDMEQLALAGYRLKRFSLVDQFPHTAHVETIALFEKEL